MTTSTALPQADDEFLDTAMRAMAADGGATALDALGWWEVLAHLDDPETRVAALTVFRAQGRTLAGSPALGGLLAQPYLEGTAIPSGTVVATVARESTRRGNVAVLVGGIGDLGDRQVLVDRPGLGASIVALDAVELRTLSVPGDLELHEVTVDWSRATTTLDEPKAGAARARSAFLGRLALALEVLGAAEGAVQLAIQHAIDREQFGQPIGRFQAVRHLLAWASTDCVAVEALARQTLLLGPAAPPRYDEVLKALAGRNGRKACERALQVLGGIGFTREHDHHRFHSRVLALDSLLGSSAAVTRDLGTWLRTTGADPGFTSAALAVGSA